MLDIHLSDIDSILSTRCTSCNEEYLAVQRLIDGCHVGSTLNDRIVLQQVISPFQGLSEAEVLW